ncbi:MAG: asparagine synthase-related protein [Bacillota bacterium]
MILTAIDRSLAPQTNLENQSTNFALNNTHPALVGGKYYCKRIKAAVYYLMGSYYATALAPLEQRLADLFFNYGWDFVQYLGDDYVIIIHSSNGEIAAFRGPGGRVPLYYAEHCERVVFATTYQPLLALPQVSRQLNEQWLINFLSLTTVHHDAHAEITLYREIKQVPPNAVFIKNAHTKIDNKDYFENAKQLALGDSVDYERAFRAVVSRATGKLLTPGGKTGVMMSGGLDSTTVAAFAAEQFKKNNLRLKVYCQTPTSDYQNWLAADRLADEREYSGSMKVNWPNIDIKYCDFASQNAYNQRDRLLRVLEQPYKIFVNANWLLGIADIAASDGLNTILTGQMGNPTISWGDAASFRRALLGSKEFRKYLARVLSENLGSDVRNIIGDILMFCPYEFRKALHLLRRREDYRHTLALINPALAKKTQVHAKLLKLGFDTLCIGYVDSRKYLLAKTAFSHLAAINYRIFLETGVWTADPTGDKEVIDFCLSVPDEQYVLDGDRSLLRRAMRGLLPDKIRLNRTVRGKQGADYIQRLYPDLPNIARDWRHYATKSIIKEYIDEPRLSRTAKWLADGGIPDERDDSAFQALMRGVIFGRFLELNGYLV